MSELPDEGLQRYNILGSLGEGAMGEVRRAMDLKLDREVALKLPFTGQRQDSKVLERFIREARSMAKVRHPNVCPIYDVGISRGQYYLTMALIEGVTLDSWVEDRPVPIDDAVIVIRKIALGVAEVHRNGIIHRDIKPSNVMIDQHGEPLLMDFGLARELHVDSILTQQGQVMGTPAYMSPEQVRADGDIDSRTDVYSLGTLLYELLTGHLPFEGSIASVFAAIIGDEPTEVSEYRPEVTSKVKAVCRKAMAKNPNDRYQSATELAEALHDSIQRVAAAEGTGSVATATTSRRPWLWVVAALATVGIMGTGLIIAFRPPPLPEQPSAWLPDGFEKTKNAQRVSDGIAHYWDRIYRVLPSGKKVPLVLVARQSPGDPGTFYIMEDKAWNELFREFANENPELVSQSQWIRGGVSVGPDKANRDVGSEDSLPIFRITPTEADHFAVWFGGRLPSARQWDRAAGYSKKSAPSQGPFRGSFSTADTDAIAVGRSQNGPLPVGTATQDFVTQTGCRDMAGNGKEFTRTLVAESQYEVPITHRKPNSGDVVVLRGRSYASPTPLTYKDLASHQEYPDSEEYRGASPYIGFRVVIEPFSDLGNR